MGVKLGTYDSYDDFGMEFLGYSIESPKPKTNTVSIPLRDGVIDMTETLSGVVRFENRKITMRFEVMDPRWERPEKLQLIHSAIHGHKISVILPDDTDHYWHGRCTLAGFADNGVTGTLTIEIDAYPFKIRTADRYVGAYTIDGTEEEVDLTILSDRAYFSFEVSGTINIEFDGDVYALSAGDDQIVFADESYAYALDDNNTLIGAGNGGPVIVPGFFLAKGDHTITLGGNGSVTIKYRGGWL